MHEISFLLLFIKFLSAPVRNLLRFLHYIGALGFSFRESAFPARLGKGFHSYCTLHCFFPDNPLYWNKAGIKERNGGKMATA